MVPGFIDPHEHLLGGSGEEGWASQTPEIALSEIVAGGITTVVGCLGTDTTTKTMPGLLAKAKAFNDEGLTAYIYSGGYNVPPITLTGSVRTDMLFVPEVIGAGEIAISDARSTEPTDRRTRALGARRVCWRTSNGQIRSHSLPCGIRQEAFTTCPGSFG